MNGSVIAVLVWAGLASAAGMTPTPWHRTIAYTLMVAYLVIAYYLIRDYGIWAALAFLALALFQLRLLFIHWIKLWIARRKETKHD